MFLGAGVFTPEQMFHRPQDRLKFTLPAICTKTMPVLRADFFYFFQGQENAKTTHPRSIQQHSTNAIHHSQRRTLWQDKVRVAHFFLSFFRS
jgi:hypothetical protein